MIHHHTKMLNPRDGDLQIRLRRQKDPGRRYARVARGEYACAMSRPRFPEKVWLIVNISVY